MFVAGIAHAIIGAAIVSGPSADEGGQRTPPSDGVDPRTRAVALGYDETRHDAPRVVASGQGALAERILELAFANGVKVRQDADLVKLLSLVEVGEEIPVEALIAVAEILSYVYRANGRRLDRGAP